MSRRLWLLVGILGVVVVIVIIAAVVLNNSLQSDPLELSDANDGLAFISNRDGTWDLFYLNGDGELINLTNGAPGEQDYFASWSLDGTAINFLSNRSGQMGPAQVKPADGVVNTLNPVQALTQMLNDGLTDWDPAWSPDGVMGYASLANGLAVNLDLYLLLERNAERERLTSDGPAGPNDWFLAWNPASDNFAYNSNRAGNENIYTMDPASGDITQLTDDAADDVHAAWAMDGEQILFVSEREAALADGELRLYIMDADGDNQQAFDATTMTFIGDPVHSANGEQIAYMSNETGQWHIYVMDADGSNVQQLTEGDADYLFPAWRPIPQTNANTIED